jgi:hypothetical protein
VKEAKNMRMTRLLVVSAVMVAGAFAGWLVLDAGADAASLKSPGPISLRVGDEMHVVGAPIGCRIARMRQLHGNVVIDCRRAGDLVGTYGTLFSAREAALVRFESGRRARLLTVATHKGEIRECGSRR